MTDKASSKRERIISAAIELWRETHNVSKVSLADIAQKAGVSPTTIYNNFGNREGLVSAVINHLIQETTAKQESIINSDLPFPLKMQGILSAKMESMQGLQDDMLSKFSADPIVNKYLDEVYETKMKPMMDKIIEDGKLQEYIDPDLSNEVVMVYLDILKEGGKVCAEKLKRIVSDSRLVTQLARVFYYGLFQKEFDFFIDYSVKKEWR